MRATKVFVIDDEAELVRSYTLALSEFYVVEGFPSGSAAFEAIRAGNHPDVIVSDIRMPGLSGIEFIAAIRGLGLVTPVIIVSGCADKQHAIDSLDLGVFALLEKPFSRQKLKDMVEKAVVFGKYRSWADAILSKLVGMKTSLEKLSEKCDERCTLVEKKYMEQGGLSAGEKGRLSDYLREVRMEFEVGNLIRNTLTEIQGLVDRQAQIPKCDVKKAG